MAYQKLQAYRALAVNPSDTINIPNPAMLAISSTTTGNGAATLKVIDALGDFINKGVKVGDIIYSLAGLISEVTAVDSATTLSVTTGIGTGRTYTLYANIDAPNNGCVLYVGTAGDLKVLTAGGDIVEFVGVLAGSFIPVQVLRVFATGQTGTAATSILALW